MEGAMAAAPSRAGLAPKFDVAAADRSSRELRLCAALIALTILVIAARTKILRIAHLGSHYPLLFYQDVSRWRFSPGLFAGCFSWRAVIAHDASSRSSDGPCVWWRRSTRRSRQWSSGSSAVH